MPTSDHTAGGRRVNVRMVLTVAELAARMERRLYASEMTDAAIRAGCRAAVRQGVAAVITLPEGLDVASRALDGSGVDLATAVGWHHPDTERIDPVDLRDEAEGLMARGATEVAYIATRERLEPGDGKEVAEHVAMLVELATTSGVKVRTILATDQLTAADIERTCRDVAAAGVSMVQGGSWRGQRAGVSQIELMRSALPSETLLKWTEPVKALGTMLLCISLGVNRFNCDIDQILGDAKRAESIAPLTVPLAGVDY